MQDLTSQSACLGTLVDSYCQKKRSGGVLQYNVYCGNNIEAPTKTHTHIHARYISLFQNPIKGSNK